MARYRVKLYGVPDKHLYDPLPLKVWRAFWIGSWQFRLALVCYGTGAGLLLHLVVR